MRELDWFKGERIVVTRARHQAAPLEDLIRQRGGVPISYPCIAIEAPEDTRPLARQLRKIDEYDWLLLTSGNAVRALQSLPGMELDPARVKIAAVGPATRAALQRELGRDCDFEADGRLSRSAGAGAAAHAGQPHPDSSIQPVR